MKRQLRPVDFPLSRRYDPIDHRSIYRPTYRIVYRHVYRFYHLRLRPGIGGEILIGF